MSDGVKRQARKRAKPGKAGAGPARAGTVLRKEARGVREAARPPHAAAAAETPVPAPKRTRAATGPHRCGAVSVAGRPNAGKSTLVNALVGDKVAITAPTAQTTRTSVRGIANPGGAQIIFTDTPGIHKSDSPLNRRMMDTVRAAMEEQDVTLFVADATEAIGAGEEQALSALRGEAPCILALNKIDRIADKRQLLPLLEGYAKLRDFAAVFPVSAKTGEGLDALLEELVKHLPEGPALFPADQYTDQPARFLVAEFIRERVLLATRQEVPHAVAVLIEKWEEEPLRKGVRAKAEERGAEGGVLTRIAATILVERTGQKKILIGREGGLLKRIGTEARMEIEKLLGGPVFLGLFVKVQPNWREDPEFLAAIDWRSMVGSS